MKERWKEPREGSEKEPETLCLQAVEQLSKVEPRTFCRTVRRVAGTGKVKHWRCGAEGKPSLNRALSQYRQTRNRVIYPCPGWSCRKRQWRSEHTSVEKGGDEVWVAEKFQSNPEIAGSPRNSFRASLRLKSCGGRALNICGGVKAYQWLSNSECRVDDTWESDYPR